MGGRLQAGRRVAPAGTGRPRSARRARSHRMVSPLVTVVTSGHAARVSRSVPQQHFGTARLFEEATRRPISFAPHPRQPGFLDGPGHRGRFVDALRMALGGQLGRSVAGRT